MIRLVSDLFEDEVIETFITTGALKNVDLGGAGGALKALPTPKLGTPELGGKMVIPDMKLPDTFNVPTSIKPKTDITVDGINTKTFDNFQKIETKLPDGTVKVEFKGNDGTNFTSVHTPDGTNIILKDNITFKTSKDNSFEMSDTDGNKLTQDSKGNISTENKFDDGTKQYSSYDPDGVKLKDKIEFPPNKKLSDSDFDNIKNSNAKETEITLPDGKKINSKNLESEAGDIDNLKNTKDETIAGKLKKLIEDNPGTTLAAALVAAIGITGFAMAYQSYAENNNKVCNITNSYATSGGSPGDTTIIYSQPTDIVNGDSITLSGTTFRTNNSSNGESPDGKDIAVIKIVSKNEIVINIPNITQYTKQGTFTLHTTYANRQLDQVGDVAKGITGGAIDIATKALDPILGPIKKALAPYINILKIVCIVICALILLGILWKIYSFFSG